MSRAGLAGSVAGMQRVALVRARSRGSRRRITAGVLCLVVLLGAVAAGRVVAADPVAYGITVWPFADDTDRAEAAVLGHITAAVPGAAGLAVVPQMVHRLGVAVRSAAVDQPDSPEGTALLRIAVGERCRDVLVRANHQVTSRRVSC
jgi:hypothetical protein